MDVARLTGSGQTLALRQNGRALTWTEVGAHPFSIVICRCRSECRLRRRHAGVE
jgi:hypothetical protein